MLPRIAAAAGTVATVLAMATTAHAQPALQQDLMVRIDKPGATTYVPVHATFNAPSTWQLVSQQPQEDVFKVRGRCGWRVRIQLSGTYSSTLKSAAEHRAELEPADAAMSQVGFGERGADTVPSWSTYLPLRTVRTVRGTLTHSLGDPFRDTQGNERAFLDWRLKATSRRCSSGGVRVMFHNAHAVLGSASVAFQSPSGAVGMA